MYLEGRLIAMLDVLGFAARIETREALESTTKRYSELIAEARRHMFEPKALAGSPNKPLPNFEYGRFVFDTLVLVSYPVEIKATDRFIFATLLLMELFFEAGYPLRGAIGIGDFSTDEEAGLFLSNAFKRLRLEEDNQQWSGCILLPEAEETVVSSLLGPANPERLLRSSALHYLPVPTKTGGTKQSWCLGWSHFLSASVLEAGLKRMSGDPDKQRNTMDYVARIAGLSDDTQILPAQFAPATRMKVMKARSGMRIKFEDDEGTAVNPGCAFSIGA